MSHRAAKWSALLGVAVTHSPNVGSRSVYRAQLWAATSSGVEPWSQRARKRTEWPFAGIEQLPLLAN